MKFGGYLLKDKKPYPVEDVSEWGKGMETMNRQVADFHQGSIRVSTVFLGLDHNFFGEGPPVLFETMVFDSAEGPLNEIQERCSTWKEAELQHKKIVRRVKQVITLENLAKEKEK